MVVISGLLDQFFQDPYVNGGAEAQSLVSQIVTALQKIKDAFIIITSRLIENQAVFPAMSRIEIRPKIEFEQTKLNLSKLCTVSNTRIMNKLPTEHKQKWAGKRIEPSTPAMSRRYLNQARPPARKFWVLANPNYLIIPFWA